MNKISRFLGFAVTASFLWTAAAGAAVPALPEFDQTLGPSAAGTVEPAKMFWKWEGWKGFFPVQNARIILKKLQKEKIEKEPPVKKFSDPFRAARILMTSA